MLTNSEPSFRRPIPNPRSRRVLPTQAHLIQSKLRLHKLLKLPKLFEHHPTPPR